VLFSALSAAHAAFIELYRSHNMNRQKVIASYQQHPQVSVLIIGGGINGIGTFRDLALQGVDVLMIDKSDFCSGVSAASSRFAHGGIRYLENGEFRLVRESLAERNRLLQNAPHAVHPQLFAIPIFSWLSGLLNAPLKFLGLLQRPSERGLIVVKIGMMFYDWFTRNNRMTPTHRVLMRSEALQHYPHLNPDIISAATYYDTLMPYAERIGLELVLDAEADNDHAHALNYVRLVGGAGENVELHDDLTDTTFTVKPRLVINASGAWIDFVNRALRQETHFMGGTKGSHIIVDHPELHRTLNDSVIYFENKDGRMCMFAPHFDKVIIGATDIRIEDPDEAVCTDAEIDYFFNFAGHVLPGITLDRSQIIFHFSGVRPLPNTKVGFEGLITRDHSIQVVEPDERISFPVYALVGGKWTTFRAFSEQTTDKALNYLGRSRRSDTRSLPIGGGKGYPRSEVERAAWLQRVHEQQTGLTLERLQPLFERYGTRAEAVAHYIAAGPDQPLHNLVQYSRREIMFMAEHEKAVRLDDVILRRSVMGLCGEINYDVLLQLGEILGAVHNWSPHQIDQEIERTASLLQTRHGVPAERLRPAAATSA
jgi:glycerol-3-phosphate dehydrogenase